MVWARSSLSVDPNTRSSIAKAVSRRLLTAAVLDRFQVRSCGICGRQDEVALGRIFFEYFRFRFRIITLPDAQTTKIPIRFSLLMSFESSGSWTGSTQLRENNWVATWMEKWRLRSRKPRLTALGIRCADRATPSIGYYYFFLLLVGWD
jgi:hypothetical protein